MPIRDRQSLFRAADDTLHRDGAGLQQLLLIYLAIITTLSLAASALTVVLSGRIENTGGLSNFGLRSVLSTAQTVLPLVQTAVMTGLQLGYTRAALSASRGKRFSRDTLFGGFRRLIPMVCAYMLQGVLYGFLAMTSMYFASFIFLMLPASADFQALITPLMRSMSVMTNEIVLDEATLAAASSTLLPVIWIWLAVFLPLFLPAYYRYRMTMFRLIDQERPRPLLAMRESLTMLQRNRIALLKIDLKLWWYYLLQALVTVVCYGDQLLPLLGVDLPFTPEINYFLFLILSLALQFVLFYFAMNRVTLVYAAAYEALLSAFEEKKAQMQERFNHMTKSRCGPWKDDQSE